MKRYIKTALALLLFLVGQAAVSENIPSQDQKWELSGQSLVSILEEEHYTPNEFADALVSPTVDAVIAPVNSHAPSWLRTLVRSRVHSLLPDLDMRFIRESGKGLLSKRHWEIQSYTFTYLSETVDGRKITMSGRVTFPNYKEGGRTHQVKTIALHTHQAFLFADWAPSQSLMFMPVKAMWDSAVIEPDLQKWGVNLGKENDGGGSAFHMARQLADCTVAALEVMRQHGVTLSPKGYTTNWGSSQGAVPSLMFAKWYDTQAPQWFKDALRLRSTFVGEGAIDLRDFTEYIYKQPEKIEPNFVVLVAYFSAFTPEQLGGYRPGEFVPQWYLAPQVQVNGREYSLLETASYFTPRETGPFSHKMTSFQEVFAPDMLQADGNVNPDSPKVQAWLSCLKRHNNLEGWTPQHSIYVAHSPKDDMIPYEHAYQLYRTISNGGKNPKVHMLSVPFPGFMPTGGMLAHFSISFLGQVLMSLEENPEDMRMTYRQVK